MTKDELTVQQLKEDATTFRVLFFVVAAACVASLALVVAAVVTGRPDGIWLFLPFAIGFATSAMAMRGRFTSAEGALVEIGDNPTDLDQWHDYSRPTMSALRSAQHTTKEYLQLWLAYGICGVMMLGLGVLGLVLLWGDEPALLAVCSLLPAGGVLLLVLTAQSFRSWRVSKRLDSLAGASLGQD